MDDDLFHALAVILLVLILLLCAFKLGQDYYAEEQSAFQFLIEQCFTETPAELTWQQGKFIISAGGNDTCWIQQT
jgi:hypothetical protein